MNKYPKNIYFGDLNNNKYTIVRKQKNILAFFGHHDLYIYRSLVSNKIFRYKDFIELDTLNNISQNGYINSETLNKLIINYLNNQTSNEKKKCKILKRMGLNDKY